MQREIVRNKVPSLAQRHYVVFFGSDISKIGKENYSSKKVTKLSLEIRHVVPRRVRNLEMLQHFQKERNFVRYQPTG